MPDISNLNFSGESSSEGSPEASRVFIFTSLAESASTDRSVDIGKEDTPSLEDHATRWVCLFVFACEWRWLSADRLTATSFRTPALSSSTRTIDSAYSPDLFSPFTPRTPLGGNALLSSPYTPLTQSGSSSSPPASTLREKVSKISPQLLSSVSEVKAQTPQEIGRYLMVSIRHRELVEFQTRLLTT